MDASEIDLVRESLRNLLDTHEPATAPKALLAADWLELLHAEPKVAIGVLAEEQGRTLSTAAMLDLVLLHGAGLPIDASHAVVLPPLRRGAELAGSASTAAIRVDGLVRGSDRKPEHWLVPSDEGLFSLAAPSLQLEPVGGFQAEAGIARVKGEVPRSGCAVLAPADAWTRALAAGRRSLAAELVGLCDRMLAETVAYVSARRQFGRAIGSFQAVKHRLADVRVALGAARAAVSAAWDAGDPTSAIAAKCLAARAHRLASTHCHQVLGGIAFTTEHGFHRFIHRGHLLDALLGTAVDLTRELGQRLIDARKVPRAPQLTHT